MIEASELGPPKESVVLAFQMRAVPKRVLESRIRALTDLEMAELEMAMPSDVRIRRRREGIGSRANAPNA